MRLRIASVKSNKAANRKNTNDKTSNPAFEAIKTEYAMDKIAPPHSNAVFKFFVMFTLSFSLLFVVNLITI